MVSSVGLPLPDASPLSQIYLEMFYGNFEPTHIPGQLGGTVVQDSVAPFWLPILFTIVNILNTGTDCVRYTFLLQLYVKRKVIFLYISATDVQSIIIDTVKGEISIRLDRYVSIVEFFDISSYLTGNTHCIDRSTGRYHKCT
jgi:hypothetical protein